MIDPKRLTEADKGRRHVYFSHGDGQEYDGIITGWESDMVYVNCYHCGCTVTVAGTHIWEDVGSE